MTGLYFYKLVSPYKDDVTKDCKLTVNEIDHNFITLKDADINDATYDELSNKITLTRNNGDTMELDISSIVDGMTTNLEVNYDSICGTITITYNDQKHVINGLITKDNLSHEILTEVITDSTLKGNGTYGEPLGMSLVEKTGTYSPAKKFIDLSAGEFLPSPQCLSIGDRFVTHESANDYGYLYNFHAVEQINNDLKHGWRIPTKEDWDKMLNAIEPCDAYKNHSSQMANMELGKVAGKLLKAKSFWNNCIPEPSKCSQCSCDCGLTSEDDEIFEDVEEEIKTEIKRKKINPRGVDLYNMKLMPAGYGDGCKVMAYFNKRATYWSSTITSALDVYTKRFDFDKAGVVQHLDCPAALFSIRLVKDYDGKNFHEVESINGQDYPCVLLPSESSEHGFAIWTASNLAFTQCKYKPVLPNNGENIGPGARQGYYLYVWNGHDFVKKEIKEGESIVLEQGLSGEYNGEYRLTHGKLVNVADLIYDDVMAKVQPQIDDINEHLCDIDDEIEDINDRISGLTSGATDLAEKLDKEIEDRKAGDSALTEALNDEIDARIQGEAELWAAVENEISARTSADTELWVALSAETEERIAEDEFLQSEIDAEISARTQADEEIKEALSAETEERIAEDEFLQSEIDTEISARTSADTELWIALSAETEERIAEDEHLQSEIDEEVSARTSADTELWIALSAETEERKDADDVLQSEIDAEISARTQADEEIKEALSAETEERIAEDEFLQSEIDAEISARTSADTELWIALSAETEERKEAEQHLQDEIDAEISARTSGDTELWIALSAETEERIAEDKHLQDEIEKETERAKGREDEIDDQLIQQSGTSYNLLEGTLTLATKGEDVDDIIIPLSSNYGTF